MAIHVLLITPIGVSAYRRIGVMLICFLWIGALPHPILESNSEEFTRQ